MFLFTEAHFWSSTKSCKRKLHSYSPVLLLLSNPLLHWSRSKTLSQRHFFYRIFRGGAEGLKCHTSPAHSPINSPLLTTGDTHWPQNTSKTGQQWNTLLAGKPSCLPQKMKPDLSKAGNKAVETLLSANPREPLSAEEKLPSSRLHRHIPGTEQKSHFCISDRDTRTPSLPATDIQHNAETMKSPATSESLNHLWSSESSFTCTLGPASSQLLQHLGILLAGKSFIILSLYLQFKYFIYQQQIHLSTVSTGQVNIQYLWKRGNTAWLLLTFCVFYI